MLVKNGPLTPSELGEQGYRAYYLTAEAIGLPEPLWSEIADNTRAAWVETLTEYDNGMRHLDGESWQEVSRRVYERLAHYKAWPEHPGPFGNQSPARRLEIECACRHIANCHQVEDGEDLDALCEKLVERAQGWLTKLAGNPQLA